MPKIEVDCVAELASNSSNVVGKDHNIGNVVVALLLCHQGSKYFYYLII